MKRDAGTMPPGFDDLQKFGLMDALLGRRSRRFFMGGEIPDGVFAYRSSHPPMPLSELEKQLVVTACGGNTGWHHMIYRARRYAPYLSNYAGAAGGRTFPSAAGYHTSTTFFSDDEGVYILDNRDAPACSERDGQGELDSQAFLESARSRIRKISTGRLDLPPEDPYVEPHNTWVVNQPGTLLVIPVGDLSQHLLLNLCYMLQNGVVLADDVYRRPIPGLDRLASSFNVTTRWPLTFVEQWSMAELTAELSNSCYAGTLMLQAMGLGGWMFNGVDPWSVLGAYSEQGVAGLGFRCDFNDQWPYPNPTGREGVLEGYCPPHVSDMRVAVEAVCRRKFGPGGPYHPATPGPWKETEKVRAAARPHSEEFRECVALQAQYIYDSFGKFPGTVPTFFVITYLQAQHLDIEFYDRFFKPGAYLESHARHMQRWHSTE